MVTFLAMRTSVPPIRASGSSGTEEAGKQMLAILDWPSAVQAPGSEEGVGKCSVPLFLARGGNFRTPQPDQKSTHHDSPHFHGRGGNLRYPQTEHKTMRHKKLIFEISESFQAYTTRVASP